MCSFYIKSSHGLSNLSAEQSVRNRVVKTAARRQFEDDRSDRVSGPARPRTRFTVPKSKQGRSRVAVEMEYDNTEVKSSTLQSLCYKSRLYRR